MKNVSIYLESDSTAFQKHLASQDRERSSASEPGE